MSPSTSVEGFVPAICYCLDLELGDLYCLLLYTTTFYYSLYSPTSAY